MFITFIRRNIRRTCVVLIGVVFSCLLSEPLQACPSTGITSTFPSYSIELRSTDPVGPFPLAALVPFPWSTIQGIWTARLPNRTNLHFSFEVRTDCAGHKYVQVIGFDQKTYRVMAEGVGFGMANDTMIRAAMTSSGSQYMLYVRQFKNPAGRATGKVSTVVTIRPFDSEDPKNDVHMVARKASNLTLQAYIDQRRELEKQEADKQRTLSGRP